MKHLLPCLIFIVSVWGTLHAAEKRPNILVILSDDQGYADTGFQGSTEIPTPHLDSLARSGIRCTQGYVSHPFCSPSRAGLITGRYQARFGHENNPVYDPNDPAEGLPLSEQLLPQLLKDGGYRTGWVGKWHLGSSPAHTPWVRGFDETFGFIGGGHQYRGWTPDSHQYTLPLICNGKPFNDVPEHLTLTFGEEAAAFVRRNAEHPWFLYLAFNAPHGPHQPTPEKLQQFATIKPNGRKNYVAQVSLLDDAIGTVLKTLDESGQTERTLIFFFSDNGGAISRAAVNTPLRGHKGTVYEGGVRVPFLVRLPEKLPAGITYDKPVSALDVVATALAAANVPQPADRPYDGVNLMPYLSGQQKESPHEKLFWRCDKSFAVREGNWKFIRTATGQEELYDLANDISETKNLATEKPEIVKQLAASLDAWNSELIAPVFPGSGIKNEDWGPDGINEKERQKEKAATSKAKEVSP